MVVQLWMAGLVVLVPFNASAQLRGPFRRRQKECSFPSTSPLSLLFSYTSRE